VEHQSARKFTPNSDRTRGLIRKWAAIKQGKQRRRRRRPSVTTIYSPQLRHLQYENIAIMFPYNGITVAAYLNMAPHRNSHDYTETAVVFAMLDESSGQGTVPRQMNTYYIQLNNYHCRVRGETAHMVVKWLWLALQLRIKRTN
jgi:hypothetical protein